MEVSDKGNLGPFDFPTASGWLLKKSLWDKLGGFNSAFKIHHDNDFLGRLNQSGARRVHLIEAMSSDSPVIPERRDKFSYLLRHSEINYLRPYLTVKRWRHQDAIMSQVATNREKADRSMKEYIACEVLYGEIPW
jgi:hypothetical protein